MTVSSIAGASVALTTLQNQPSAASSVASLPGDAPGSPIASLLSGDLTSQVQQLTDIVGRVALSTPQGTPLVNTDTSSTYSLTERVAAWKALQLDLWNAPAGALSDADRVAAGDALTYSALGQQISTVTRQVQNAATAAAPEDTPSQSFQIMLSNFNNLSASDQQLFFQTQVQDPLKLQADGQTLGIGQGFTSIADYTANLQANIGLSSLIENALANGTITASTPIAEVTDPTLQAALALYGTMPSSNGAAPSLFESTPFATTAFTAQANAILAASASDPTVSSAPTSVQQSAGVAAQINEAVVADATSSTASGTDVAQVLENVFQAQSDSVEMQQQAAGTGVPGDTADYIAFDNSGPGVSVADIQQLLATLDNTSGAYSQTDQVAAWDALTGLFQSATWGNRMAALKEAALSQADTASGVNQIYLPSEADVAAFQKLSTPVWQMINQALNSSAFNQQLQSVYSAANAGLSAGLSDSQYAQQELTDFNKLSASDQQLWFLTNLQPHGYASIADYRANLQANVAASQIIDNALQNKSLTWSLWNQADATGNVGLIQDPELRAVLELSLSTQSDSAAFTAGVEQLLAKFAIPAAGGVFVTLPSSLSFTPASGAGSTPADIALQTLEAVNSQVGASANHGDPPLLMLQNVGKFLGYLRAKATAAIGGAPGTTSQQAAASYATPSSYAAGALVSATA